MNVILNQSQKVDGRRFHAWARVELPEGGYRLYGYFRDDGGLTSVSSTDGIAWQEDPGYRMTEFGADPEIEAGFLKTGLIPQFKRFLKVSRWR